MSNLFGDQKGAGNIPSRNIMKDDFGWDIPFESIPIPSKGVIYSPNSILHNKQTVQIKAMTAREEDILSSQALIKEGTVVDNLIESCVSDPGFNSSELLMGDRNALLVAIRITGYGSDYYVKHRCAYCSTYNDATVNLSNLPIKRLQISPVEEGKNLFLFKLPITKKEVLFKFKTAEDEKNNFKEQQNIRKNNLGIISGDITKALEQAIYSVGGITDRNKIKHFILNMPALDAKKLREYIRENEPGMDMMHSYNCKECGSLNEMGVPITTEFFWPTK